MDVRLKEAISAVAEIPVDDAVEAARDVTNPMNPHLTWDDGEAAIKQRRSEMRALIRTVKLVVVHESAGVLRVPAFVRDPDRTNQEGGYISIQKIATEHDRARAVVIRECERVKAAVERMRAVAHFLEMTDETEEMQRFVASLSERAGQGGRDAGHA